MYQVGELVSYGNTGVCRVSEIRTQVHPSTGEQGLYYILQPLYQSCVISTPVNSDKVFIRPIISREEAERLILRIPGRQPRAYYSRVTRELSEHYDALLKTHNCEDLIDLTMSIHAKKQDLLRQKKKFGSVDERFLKRAEELLFGELGAALGISRDKVPDYIAARIGDTEKVG